MILILEIMEEISFLLNSHSFPSEVKVTTLLENIIKDSRYSKNNL